MKSSEGVTILNRSMINRRLYRDDPEDALMLVEGGAREQATRFFEEHYVGGRVEPQVVELVTEHVPYDIYRDQEVFHSYCSMSYRNIALGILKEIDRREGKDEK